MKNRKMHKDIDIPEFEAKERVEVNLGPRGGMVIKFKYFRWFVSFVPVLASQGKTAESIWEFLYNNTWNPRKKEGLEKRRDEIINAIKNARR